MKNLFLIAVFSLGLNFAYAQKIREADLPSKVKDSFSKLYPQAKVEKWEKEGALYEAEFDNGKIETSATFDVNGGLVETEVEIPVTELPLNAKEYINQHLNGKKPKEASRITDSAGAVSYEAEVGESDYIFDAEGNYLKKVEKDKKDKD